MKDSDTPLTDAVDSACGVPGDFARTLERRCKRLESHVREMIRLYESKWSDEPEQLKAARTAVKHS